jgi:hypothetical protein
MTPRRAPQPLLPLDVVRRRLKIVGQRYGGPQTIPVERIVGSVNRFLDFDRAFTPRSRESRARIASLRRAFPDGDLPPIEVFEAGGAYFVSDGHHRVALARQDGGEFIDAEVIHLETNYEIPPDADIPSLVHTELRRRFLEESGLALICRDAEIEVSHPAGYAELTELVKAHAWDLALRAGRLPEGREVARSWWAEVYSPAVEAIRAANLRRPDDETTETDLFLWLHQQRRRGCASGRGCDLEDAIRDAAGARPSRWTRRALRRERSAPLRLAS